MSTTYGGPWTTCREEWVEEEQEIAGNLCDDVKTAHIPRHTKVKQFFSSWGVVILL